MILRGGGESESPAFTQGIAMGALEDFFKEDQEQHRLEDAFLLAKSNHELTAFRQVFHWRLNTRKASKALICLRHFSSGNVVITVSSLPDSYFKFSQDFAYAFSVICGNFDLQPQKTACFEWFLEPGDLGLFSKKYIQFRLTGDFVSRETLTEQEFCHFINQLKNQGNRDD